MMVRQDHYERLVELGALTPTLSPRERGLALSALHFDN